MFRPPAVDLLPQLIRCLCRVLRKLHPSIKFFASRVGEKRSRDSSINYIAAAVEKPEGQNGGPNVTIIGRKGRGWEQKALFETFFDSIVSKFTTGNACKIGQKEPQQQEFLYQ